MDDIVKRLQGLNRSPDHDHAFIISPEDVADAIDEIENLRAFIASLRPGLDRIGESMDRTIAANKLVAAILNRGHTNG